MTTTKMETLVSTEWLSQHLDDPDLVVLDCTVLVDPENEGGIGGVSGRADYDAAHIPTSGFADLTGDLCDTSSPLQFVVPTPVQFCAAMGALGVGDDSRVVLYDGFMSMWAARVWWMLRWVGFDQAAILDGGINAWMAEDRPLSTEPANRPTKRLTPAPRPELIADRAEVFAAIDDENVIVVDTLMPEHFRGEMVMYGGRPGHIPGAVNLCALDLFDESGCFKPEPELAALHTGDRNARTITYCGGGIMASCNAFVMTRLGFTNMAVYTASLQEWATDPTNPMVVEAS